MAGGGPAPTSSSGKNLKPLTNFELFAATVCFLGVQFGTLLPTEDKHPLP